MKTSTKISKLVGLLESEVITTIQNNHKGQFESPCKNINYFTFDNDKELNRVSIYTTLGIVTKISYGYNV